MAKRREPVLKPGGEQDISEGSSKGGESHADDNASPSQDVSPQMSLVSRAIETLILEDDPEKVKIQLSSKVMVQLCDEDDRGISPRSNVRDELALGALHSENVPREERS